MRAPHPRDPHPLLEAAPLAALCLAAVAAQVVLDGDVLGRSLGLAGWSHTLAAIVLLVAAASWALVTRSGWPPVPPIAAAQLPSPSLARTAVIAAGMTLAWWPVAASPTWPLAPLVRTGPGLGRAGNTLTAGGATCWLLGVLLVAAALVRSFRSQPTASHDRDRIGPGTLAALLLVLAVATFFRCHDLASLPPEMISDHAEMLLDVRDLHSGGWPVFFPANGGREPLEFYLVAVLTAAGLPLGFMTLKLAAALVGLATVAAVFALGREVGGTRLGGLSAAVVAVMPWHVQVTRLGLRAQLSPLFAALTLTMLLRACRSGNRALWLTTGALAGAGLYGYTGFRPMLIAAPLAVLAAVAIAHRDGTVGQWRRVLVHATAAATLGSLVALPLVGYAARQPDAFWRRSVARVGTTERARDEPMVARLADGWLRTLGMCNVTSDRTWALSPTGRPALDPVAGGLLILGVTSAVAGALRRDWRLGALLAATPVMLAASALAIAFPEEIPHLARAAGALPAVAVLIALPLDRLLADRGRMLPALAVAIALGAMAVVAHYRVFVEYRATYDQRSLPVSRGAAVARAWIAAGGRSERVILVGWPFGWDWRSLAFELGDPDWRQVLVGERPDMRDAVDQAVADPAGTLFLLGGPRARDDAARLEERYPTARPVRHAGRGPGQSFWSVVVPPAVPGSARPASPP